MIVGLTGGMGSGKSVVAKIFETLGCAVFNSDHVAKEIYFDPTIRLQIIKLLGEESYLPESLLNKTFISAKIFNNSFLLQALNNIIHPAVSVAFKNFITKNSDKVVVKESALLFEAKAEEQVDKIVLVVADEQLRLKRIINRDKLTEQEIRSKIRSQWSQEEKIKRSDFVIFNNEAEFLTPQVINVLKEIKYA